MDDGLEDNLRTFFDQDYPEFELIFGLADVDDPALAVVDRLRRQYPNVQAKTVVDSRRIGMNPKINNMSNMYSEARYDVVVISDSNVRVRSNYLTDMVTSLGKPGIGLVTSSIRGIGARSFGSRLENLHLNSFIAGSVFAVKKVFSIPITIGKSMCFRKETLESLGGFEAFSHYLAEDFLIGDGVRRMGLGVTTAFDGIDSVNVTWTIRKFLNRHFRWGTMRRHVNLLHYGLEILSNPTFIAFIYALIVHDLRATGLFVTATALHTVIEWSELRTTSSSARSLDLLLIPVKNLMLGFLWLAPFFVRNVNWRGNRFRISKNTKLSPLPDSLLSRWTTAFSRLSGRLSVDGTRKLIARFVRS